MNEEIIKDLLKQSQEDIEIWKDLYNQEKESHKIDNENYKILHDDVTALAKYIGLEEDAIIDEMYEAFDKEKEKNKKLEEERLTGIQVKCMQDEAYIKARADFERDYRENRQLYERVINRMAKQISCLSRNLDNATNSRELEVKKMNNILLKLKHLLNGLTDEELKSYSLWINNEDEVEIIAVDDGAVVLITDESKVKIDDKEW